LEHPGATRHRRAACVCLSTRHRSRRDRQREQRHRKALYPTGPDLGTV